MRDVPANVRFTESLLSIISQALRPGNRERRHLAGERMLALSILKHAGWKPALQAGDKGATRFGGVTDERPAQKTPVPGIKIPPLMRQFEALDVNSGGTDAASLFDCR